MINFSYTLSPYLKKDLEKLEKTRKNILLTPLSPREKIQLRWETRITRIAASMRMQKTDVRRKTIADFLQTGSKRPTPTQQSIYGYNKAINYIYQDWQYNPNQLSFHDINHLSSLLGTRITRKDELSSILQFVQVNPEHPVIQAALMHILIFELTGTEATRLPIGNYAALLMLSKDGFDMRGFLVFEEFLAKDIEHFQELINSSLASKNFSEFLSYFTNAVTIQAEKALDLLKNKHFEKTYPDAYFDLNQRQKDILSILEQPNRKISNKQVQEIFNVSQITASRDLAKLAGLGLIFTQGKGRSVTYSII